MSHLIFYNEHHSGTEIYNYREVLLISVIEGLLLWETNRLVLLYFHRKYPLPADSTRRTVFIFAGCITVTVVVRYLNIWFYDKTLFWGYLFPAEGYMYNILIALLYVLIIAGLYECIFYFRQWKSGLLEAEALKRANMQTQLDSLKVQINPHFLFNNLSSLSSLVTEDPKQAVLFIRELSSVYRYLLQANEQHLTTLREELRFIDHYFHLLKTRFGDSTGLRVLAGEDEMEKLLPPLTLQLLVENAIKHNVLLPDDPLLISISTTPGSWLKVSNSIRLKSVKQETGKLGLRNIREKYRLLGQYEIVVHNGPDLFEVSVPLIKPD